jgi:hypothetical protein
METEPRFKFGQCVQAYNSPESFTVEVIKLTEFGFYYSKDKYLVFVHEDDLKLIERPKRKVKKRFYMMAYKTDSGNWMTWNDLVDENFVCARKIERWAGKERKILENSPYIELDFEE